MSKAQLPRPVTLALAALLLVFALLSLALASLESFQHARNNADHTTQVRATLARTLRLIVDAETGQRGFLLTGVADYLRPYDLARRDLPEAVRDLRVLSRDNPAALANLAELDGLAQTKLDELAETIALEKAGAHDRAVAVVASNRGKGTMDAIRGVQAAMVSAADAQFVGRTAAATRFARASFFGITAASCLLVVLGLLLQSVGQRLARREIAEHRVVDLENFAGRLAHDVKSPLASVGLALDLARRHPGDPKTDAAIETAGKTLRRVSVLVDGLLAFASAGARPDQAEQADVGRVLRDVVDGAQAAAQGQRVDLELENVIDTIVACSPGVLTSMASNLVDNAIKYIGSGPTRRVTVRSRRSGSKTRVEVQDTGSGVPRELRATIFDPYVRGASGSPGIGLGLATVRRLAEAHGGAAGIARSSRDGSLFWFELPNAPRPRPSVVSTERGLGLGSGSPRISS